ncbi:hypothetical protein EUX98_g5198 [Antrodiella citrinella]|uniref:NADP-dependent oxidoreductase domain-containing protein n=1 Tax=Antrodiella citrinella TaxID=2447956 RepID=A0A4S4MUK7_9APHY|nr:hypothetical protein EUX98_g5198 [Antrodiella citrinella]
MSHWAPPPLPKTKLGRYRQLSPLAGVHVSPIALGGMSIGDKWEPLGMGSMTKEQSFKLLDAYYDAGGNYIDTANNYQDESSEEFIGEWIETRGIRDQIFLATKYTNNFKRGEGPEFGQKVMYTGNNLKSMYLSVEASLKKLRTTYIDLFYVHWWDYKTTVEEVMSGLHHLVSERKVLYLGISDTPAWIVTAANTYAKLSGKTPFVIYQGCWNVMVRDFEREILPMALNQGMALAPYNVLVEGRIRTDEEEERRRQTGEGALESIAKEVGAQHITSVAIAYVMQKAPHVFPIVGGRKVEHLMSNIEALNIALTPAHIQFIESVFPFTWGFPYDFFGPPGGDYPFLYKTSGHFDKWPVAEAIRPAAE